jgi:hypothetical protein
MIHLIECNKGNQRYENQEQYPQKPQFGDSQIILEFTVK